VLITSPKLHKHFGEALQSLGSCTVLKIVINLFRRHSPHFRPPLLCFVLHPGRPGQHEHMHPRDYQGKDLHPRRKKPFPKATPLMSNPPWSDYPGYPSTPLDTRRQTSLPTIGEAPQNVNFGHVLRHLPPGWNPRTEESPSELYFHRLLRTSHNRVPPAQLSLAQRSPNPAALHHLQLRTPKTEA